MQPLFSPVRRCGPHSRRVAQVWKASMAISGSYSIPQFYNEDNQHYEKSSPERDALTSALKTLRSQLPVKVSSFIGGKSQPNVTTTMPSEKSQHFASYTNATESEVQKSIEAALQARQEWQDMPFINRAAIFLRAAELVSGKYRYELMAVTMLGQGKNIWQAEIDTVAELADFFRINVANAQKIYEKQPTINSKGHFGRTDYRPLEGFVYAVSPFNFTAIGGNLISVPAIMGNVVVWKPSPSNVYASSIVYKILLEAGMPPNVIQFVTGDAELITKTVLNHPMFSALNFVGSSDVFSALYSQIGKGVGEKLYRDFPRLIGETSGKNFHLLHSSADMANAAKHTIRASFEYAGQKCSACSRIYVPQSKASEFFSHLKKEMGPITVGPPEEHSHFTGPVIHEAAFDKVKSAMDSANNDPNFECVIGGSYDRSKGYFIQPTVYISKTLDHPLFNTELFGPVLVAYIYPDAEYPALLSRIDAQGGGFALAGSIFATDRQAIQLAEDRLRFSAGNFYLNCKTTGAVIGQQTFGGGRASGTNDKAGSENLLMRFVSPRTLKEEYGTLQDVRYPSNL